MGLCQARWDVGARRCKFVHKPLNKNYHTFMDSSVFTAMLFPWEESVWNLMESYMLRIGLRMFKYVYGLFKWAIVSDVPTRKYGKVPDRQTLGDQVLAMLTSSKKSCAAWHPLLRHFGFLSSWVSIRKVCSWLTRSIRKHHQTSALCNQEISRLVCSKISRL